MPGEGLVQAKVDLRPYGWDEPRPPGRGRSDPAAAGRTSGWPATSPPTSAPGVLRHDHVLGIGQASTTLVQVTARRHVARALDLGTGCGIQTFHLLHHAEHVTATDISGRALAFTRFNLLLNADELHLDPADLEARVSLRLGSLLDPVAGEEFELVVSNPPFVITPRTAGRGRRGPVHLPRRRPAGGRHRRLAGPGAALASWRPAEQPSFWATGRSRRARPGPNGRRAGPARTRTSGSSSASRSSPEQYAETWLQDASEARDRRLYQDVVRRLPGRLRLPQRGGHRLRHDLAAAARRRRRGR